MTFDTPLANGHLLNLQPRPHRGKGTMLGSDADDTQDDGPVELSTRSGSNNSEANTSATSPQSKATPTRLPVLKDFTDKDHRERKDISTPVKQKGRDWSSEHESPKSLDQERERYWRKVRGRFDRDTLSPRNKEKQKANYHGAYRKIISLASSPRQEIAQKLKYSGSSSSEKSCTSETSPAAKANNSTPERQNDSKESTSSNQDRFSDGKGRMNSNHSASSGGSGSSSQKFKTDSTTDSSYNSNSSVSPISGPSTKEWEDKFVVNMPSAREPNPPTLNVRQITQYQNSIEKVQKEGVSMVDPDTLPSPRTLTPEHHLRPPDQNGKRLGMLDGQDSRPSSSNKDADSGLTYPDHPHYYCPDEVGKQRFSTIWEESSTSPKQKSPNANPDGSFLGCKEINGPHDRNPDEILYFSTPERPKVVNIPPSRTPRMPRELKLAPLRQTERAPGESLVQEEWEPISQNLKHAQCSKLSPKLLCREAQCQQLKTKKFTNPTAKEGPDSTGKRTGSSENLKSNPRADDVFIITPTITRTMVTMTDLRHDPPRNAGVREPTARSAGEIITDTRTKLPINTKAGASPSGLRRVSQNSWERLNAHSAKASDPAPAMNIPAVRHRAEAKATTTDRSTAVGKPRGMRGFTRTPGIPRSSTETRIDTPPDKTSGSTDSSLSTRATNIPSRKSTPRSSEARRSSLTDRTIYSPSAHRSSSQPCGTMMQAKIVDVAELDGHQVNDHRENNFGNNSSHSNYDQLDNRIRPDITRIMSSETLHMIIDMIFLFGNQVQGFCQQIKANRGSKLVLLKLFLNGILGMLEHCLLVLRKGLAVISAYNTTGVWPKANDKDLAWLFTDLGQALVYLVVLGFVAMVIARAVGFVILIGSWVVWFARPFALAFRTVSRVLSL
ncbi:hypothetical protein BDW62DRAFT_86554 [Aspergillus aurantiobrunneus]